MPRRYYPLLKTPIWVDIALSQVGITGKTASSPVNPEVSRYIYGSVMTTHGIVTQTDGQAYCSWGTAWCLRQAGLRTPEAAWAYHYLHYGVSVTGFPFGGIVLDVGDGHVTGVGHVSFAWKKINNAVITIGFNQYNRTVGFLKIMERNVVDVRWPTERDVVDRGVT